MSPQTIQVRTENNDFQHVEVLKRNRTKRQQYGECFVEGVIPLSRALEYGWALRTLVYPAGVRLSKWAQEIIDRSTAEVHLALSPALMARLSSNDGMRLGSPKGSSIDRKKSSITDMAPSRESFTTSCLSPRWEATAAAPLDSS